MSQTYDKTFKQMLEMKNLAVQFVQTYLPEEFKSLIDINTFKNEKCDFIEENLKACYTDVLISCKLKNKQKGLIFCLIEHQTKTDSRAGDWQRDPTQASYPQPTSKTDTRCGHAAALQLHQIGKDSESSRLNPIRVEGPGRNGPGPAMRNQRHPSLHARTTATPARRLENHP